MKCNNARPPIPATLGRMGKWGGIHSEKEKKEIRDTYFSVFREIDFQRFGVVFKPQRGHGKQDVLTVNRLSFLVLTFFGGWKNFFARWSGGGFWNQKHEV